MRSLEACKHAWPALGAFLLVSACDGSDGTEALGLDASSEFPPAAEVDTLVDASAAIPDAAEAPPTRPPRPPPMPADAAVGLPPDAEVPVSCPVDLPTSCPEGSPRYADVAPIIEARCVVCHSPRWTGPWPLDTISHLRDWFDDVRTTVGNCTMPPPEARVPITKDERMQLLQWVRCGMPD